MMIERTPRAAGFPRRTRARARVGAIAVFAIVFLAACTGHGEDEGDLPVVAQGINANFAAAKAPACSRADLLSLQKGSVSGSMISLDLTLTDCDASLAVTGVAFEINYDTAVVDLIGCSTGALFPSGQLAPGTPECKETGGGILGTISLVPSNAVRVGGAGMGVAVRLTFNLTRKGLNSPVTFTGVDSLNNTAVFYIDPATQAATSYSLGADGYAGGNFLSN